jgi:outer membrane receptor protein involved in Fe transport
LTLKKDLSNVAAAHGGLLELTRLILFVVALYFSAWARAAEPVNLKPLDATPAMEGEIEDFEELDLEELLNVVFSASKHRQDIFWSPSAITVITREEILSSGAMTLPDLFRRVAGLDVMDITYGFQVVGARAQTDESCNLILALIDGREALLEVSGMTMWLGLTTDLEEIERIEIIRGPGSALYGANAYAGVINIITVPEKSQSRYDFSLLGGNLGYIRLNGQVRENWQLGNGELSLQFMLANQTKRSTATPRMLNYIPLRAHSVLRYRLGKALDVSVHGGFHTAKGRWFTHVGDLLFQDSALAWGMLQVTLGLTDDLRLKLQAYHHHTEGTFKSRTNLSAFDVWIADFSDMHVTFPASDAQLQLDWRLSDSLHLVTGASLRYNSVECPTFTPTFFDEIRAAGFAQAQWTIAEQVQLSGGLRLDFSDRYDPALSPRLVAVYRPADNFSIRTGYGLAFRKPSLYESHAHFSAESWNPATPEIVDKLRESLGNEALTNEKVHSFEIGSRLHLLEDRLRLTLDLYFNIYQDNIIFNVDLTEMMGLPNIRQSTIRYENKPDDLHALGGEFEAVYSGDPSWQLWGNLGLRRVTSAETGELEPSEPILRVNLGGRYAFDNGIYFNLAVHYVSTYAFLLADPSNLLDERIEHQVGNSFTLVARLAYQVPMGTESLLEAGLLVRSPLGSEFREYPGMFMPQTAQRENLADWGGEILRRWVVIYLRGKL